MTTVLENPALAQTEPFVAQFKALTAAAGSPKWVQQLRSSAIAHLTQTGFPTLRHEEWKYTNIAPLLTLPLQPAADARQLTLEDIKPFIFGKLDCYRMVFVDGLFAPQLSTLPISPRDFQAGSLRERIGIDGREIEKHLGQHALYNTNAFTALNTALFQDGAFISIAAGKVVDKPFHLLFIATATEPGASAHLRNLILAAKGSSATVLETFVSLSSAPVFTNAVTELVLGPNAQIEHCKVQNESEQAFHISTVHANQSKDSRWTSHSISTGARLARNQIETTLNGEGAQAILNGLYLGHGDQLVDHHTVVDHAKPHCESHEFYHGILDNRARGVFNGKIYVQEDAQKTNAKQNNRNLLLSDEAVIDTKPQLEIFADDVKCTHGATVGQLNEEQLFYLRARGIGLESARRMLIIAFAATVIERISIEAVRTELETTLMERFSG